MSLQQINRKIINIEDQDQTNTKIIPLSLYKRAENRIETETETTKNKITIDIPEGYSVKVILEKKDEMTKNNYTDILDECAISQENVMDSTSMFPFNSAYDIMNLRNNNKKRVQDMKNISELFKQQINYLLFSLTFVIISLIGIALFYRTGIYFIHPILYIATFLMGLGWFVTILVSIYNNRFIFHEKK